MTAAAAASCSYAARSLPLLGAIWPTKWRPLSSHHRIYIDSVGRTHPPFNNILLWLHCSLAFSARKVRIKPHHAGRPAWPKMSAFLSVPTLDFPRVHTLILSLAKWSADSDRQSDACSVQAGKEIVGILVAWEARKLKVAPLSNDASFPPASSSPCPSYPGTKVIGQGHPHPHPPGGFFLTVELKRIPFDRETILTITRWLYSFRKNEGSQGGNFLHWDSDHAIHPSDVNGN